MIDTASSWSYVDSYKKPTDKWWVCYQEEGEKWEWKHFTNGTKANQTYDDSILRVTINGTDDQFDNGTAKPNATYVSFENATTARILWHNNRVVREDGDDAMIDVMTEYARKQYIDKNYWLLSEEGDSSLDCAGAEQVTIANGRGRGVTGPAC